MPEPRFSIGDVVIHKRLGYRGAVMEVRHTAPPGEHWNRPDLSYEQKEACWYKVLVDDANHTTLIAEYELELDDSNTPIKNPQTSKYFRGFEDGQYQPTLF